MNGTIKCKRCHFRAKIYCEIKHGIKNITLRQFALHPQAHLDICIIPGLTNQVIAVIEVDGKYHNKAEQIERDNKKNQILEHHHISIWRLRSKDPVENQDIENWVEKILEENQWRQIISDKMESSGEGGNEIVLI